MLYNEKFEEYSTMLDSFLNLYNSYRIIIKYYNSPLTQQSLNISTVYFVYNLFIQLCLILISVIIFCTIVYTFRESAALEVKIEDNVVLNKLGKLEETIDKLSKRKKENSINNINNIKQIIWLGFEGTTEVYNEKLYLLSKMDKKDGKCEDNKILLFNNSHQIISFFKYLFAIKPKLQFKNLEDKFSIVIECSTDEDISMIKEREYRQIYFLFDWLNFAGCKIPVAVFTFNRLEKNLRMNIINNFSNIVFVDNKFDLDIFLKINNKEDFSIGKSPKKKIHFIESEIYDKKESKEKKDDKRISLIFPKPILKFSENNLNKKNNNNFEKDLLIENEEENEEQQINLTNDV